MRKVLKWLSALIVIVALGMPANASGLLDCIKAVEAEFDACTNQAIVAGITGAVVGGTVGVLGGLAGIGIGACAGFLTGAGPRAYACADNYIRQSDHCYAAYPLLD